MSRERLREELIQVAAVAVSILEDLDYGEANNMNVPEREGVPEYALVSQTNLVLSEVDDERYRQDRKWGPQHHDPKTWMAILAEEVGEAADEISIPGPMDTRSSLDYIVERAGELGRRAKTLLDTVVFPK